MWSLPLIRETLERYPTLCATRLLEMCRARGYGGQITQLRAAVRRLRPRTHAVLVAGLWATAEQRETEPKAVTPRRGRNRPTRAVAAP